MEDIENSMQDKMIKMHVIAFEIEKVMGESNIKLSDDEMNLLYCILDGLTEKYIMDRVTGHCSLQDMLDNPSKKLESIIDTEIVGLLAINEKYGFKIDISEIDNKIANMK